MKTILAAAAAAIAVQPLVMFVWVIALPVIPGGVGDLHFEDLLVLAALTLLVATPFVLILGVPGFLLLKRYGRVTRPSLAVLGSLAGILPIMVLNDRQPPIPGQPPFGPGVLILGVHGWVGALAFFQVWQRSEDRRETISA